ncbi:hypothetical protein [Acanthopleuribacter pedis]|uniref:Uncharacterized protein n=1 Tax=Acanthopleuribacter pedis TaxID=442870 RepID=A0A8J7U262_9BACT|nr:hypothetical protein [Acanthopleuribacter pedis]MBO1318272.1 hypothetical protein [Acanthopleuribacter pedis]
MKHNPQLIYIILQLQNRREYTFIQAARVGLPERVQRQRRSLANLAKNNSFNGYKRRPGQTESAYRNQMRREYGPLGDCIHVRTVVARNGRPYDAFSGVIFKIALGERLLRIGLLSLATVVFTPLHQPDQFGSFGVSAEEFGLVTRMLHAHKENFAFDAPFQKRDWFTIIPTGAFNAMLEWALGTPPLIPATTAPDLLKKALVDRLRAAGSLPAMIQRDVSELSHSAQKRRGHTVDDSAIPVSPQPHTGFTYDRYLLQRGLPPEANRFLPVIQEGTEVVPVRPPQKRTDSHASGKLLLLPGSLEEAQPQAPSAPSAPKSRFGSMLLVSAAFLVLAFGVGRMFLPSPKMSYVDQVRADQMVMALYAQLDLEVAQEVLAHHYHGPAHSVIVTPDTLESVFIPEP